MRLTSHIIAVLVEDISDPFFSAIARFIEEEAHREGYGIFYSSTGNDSAVAGDLIRVYRNAGVNAYIIAPPPGIAAEIGALMEDQIPVILFDRWIPGLAANTVVVDNFNGSVLAVRHLLQNGYQRIGFVTLDSDQTQMADRLEGYTSCSRQYRLPSLILRIPFGLAPAVATHRIRTFLQQEEAPDAVIFATNHLAITGLRAITHLGLVIPDDIAVLSFDDSPYFALCSPSITAIAQPVQAISQAVIRHLILALSGAANGRPEETAAASDRPEQTTVLPVELIVRQSTVPQSILNRNQILPR